MPLIALSSGNGKMRENFFSLLGVLCKNYIDFFPIFNKPALHSQIQDGDQVTFCG